MMMAKFINNQQHRDDACFLTPIFSSFWQGKLRKMQITYVEILAKKEDTSL